MRPFLRWHGTASPLWQGIMPGLLGALVAVGCPIPAAAQAVPAAAHLQSAQRQAQGDAALTRAVRQWCSAASAPATAALAAQRLQAAEADHRHERAQPVPDADRLRLAVVLRGCAAYHASRLLHGSSHPVWLHTQLLLVSVKPGKAGFEVTAKASTVDGPVVNSRITFARGLHHACFAATDAVGMVTCTLMDTHPHGNKLDGWTEAHEGPFVATLAGSMASTVVQLPAVALRQMPVFSSGPIFR